MAQPMDSWLIFQHFYDGVMQGRIRLTIAELRLCRLVHQSRKGQKIYLAHGIDVSGAPFRGEDGEVTVPRKAAKR